MNTALDDVSGLPATACAKYSVNHAGSKSLPTDLSAACSCQQHRRTSSTSPKMPATADMWTARIVQMTPRPNINARQLESALSFQYNVGYSNNP